MQRYKFKDQHGAAMQRPTRPPRAGANAPVALRAGRCFSWSILMNEDIRKAEPVADEAMVKNAVGEENFDALAEPPCVDGTKDHPRYAGVIKVIKEYRVFSD